MRTGFVGLGSMGLAIAKNIAAKGIEVFVYDIKPEVAPLSKTFNGRFVPKLEQMGDYVDKVIFFVNTFTQCCSCLDTLLPNLKNGTIILGTTMSPREACSVDQKCAPFNVGVIDAPVSGGVKGAADATLTLMLSGDLQRIESCRPIFETYSNKIFYAGEKVGMAQTLKAINQLLFSINVASVCEAYSMGIACGLDPEIIFKTILECSGTSRAFENRSRYIIDRNFEKRSSLSIQSKDMKICEEIANELGTPLPIGSLCSELFHRAAEQFDPEEDCIALIKLFENMKISGSLKKAETRH